MARPTAFKKEYCEQSRKLCLLGATDKDIASFFGVSEKTVNNWKARPEFLQSLKAGKAGADVEVVDRLYQRALGFEYDKAIPIKLKEVIYENGKRVKETERVEVVWTHEVVPPDTTACIFWLKNRRPSDWRDKQELGGPNGPIDIRVSYDSVRPAA